MGRRESLSRSRGRAQRGGMLLLCLLLALLLLLCTSFLLPLRSAGMQVVDGRKAFISSRKQAFRVGSRSRGSPAEDQVVSPFDEILHKDAVVTAASFSQEMVDPWSVTRQLSDQINLLKAYIVIAKQSANFPLAAEMESAVRATQALLSSAASRGATVGRGEAEENIRKMSLLVFQAVELRYDSAVQLVKLTELVKQQEESIKDANTKAAYFSQMAAEAVPKGLHCLGMELSSQWVESTQLAAQSRFTKQVKDPLLHHFCVISDNVLAVATVVNSTVVNAIRPDLIVFHVTTDSATISAMQMWFTLHPPGKAHMEIQTIDSLEWLNASYSPVMRQLQEPPSHEYYFRAPLQESSSLLRFRNPKYLSLMNHLRFYLPEMYPYLDRVVFLDDDVIVQKDLSALFSIDLQGNVNGAVETCLESFHRFYKYMNFSHPLIRDSFDPHGCAWAFGMNVFDLRAWRRNNLTQVYHFWQEHNHDHNLWKLGTLPPGLLTFYGVTLPLNRSWHVLGLGYNEKLEEKTLKEAAVLHWNGNMKPWLKIAIGRYKHYWDLYIDFSDKIIQQCNIH